MAALDDPMKTHRLSSTVWRIDKSKTHEGGPAGETTSVTHPVREASSSKATFDTMTHQCINGTVPQALQAPSIVKNNAEHGDGLSIVCIGAC